MMILGLKKNVGPVTFRINSRTNISVSSYSAMTPFRKGRTTSNDSGTRPNMPKAVVPYSTSFISSTTIATTVGSWIRILLPSAIWVLKVPKSMPNSRDNAMVSSIWNVPRFQ